MNRLVVIKWIDSSIQNHQVDRHELPKPEQITSAGFIIDETNDYITITRDQMSEDSYRGLLCIPKICILERQ